MKNVSISLQNGKGYTGEKACPATQEYIEAFEAIKDDLTQDQRRLLFAHIASVDFVASIDELNEHTDCETVEEAEKQYALLGRVLTAHLEFRFSIEGYIPERLQPVIAIATPIYWTGGSVREWKMRGEVMDALSHVKL